MTCWENEPETLRCLFLKQAALCHKFNIKLDRLDLDLPIEMIRTFQSLQLKTSRIVRSAMGPVRLDSITLEEKLSIRNIINEVKNAKEAYELAGGTYENIPT